MQLLKESKISYLNYFKYANMCITIIHLILSFRLIQRLAHG